MPDQPDVRQLLHDALMEHTPDNVGRQRVDRVLDAVWPTLEPLLLSNVSVGEHRLTWQEAHHRAMEVLAKASAFAAVLHDLDRCEHGRHEGDPCSGCDGPSHGNPVVQLAGEHLYMHGVNSGDLPARLLGFSVHGGYVVVPDAEHLMTDPGAWRYTDG